MPRRSSSWSTASEKFAARDRVGRAEEPAAHGRGAAVVVGGRDVLRRLHDVLEAGAGSREQPPELFQDIARLADDVAGRDERARLVDGGGAGDEQQVAD